MNRAQANLSGTKSGLQQADASFNEAKASYERNRILFQKGIISKADWDKSIAAFEVAKSSKESAYYNVKSASASVIEAKDNLGRTVIYAPADGTVSVLNVELGERVLGTQQMAGTEILRVANLNNMEVEVDVNEKFESQSQQNFFWAKCNTSKGVKKNKWCELAREFSDSTSKKQYKTMPKKKNPEKMDESYEKFLEDKIVGMIERRIEPKMTKGDILKTISEKMEKNNSMMLRNPKKMSMFSHESGIEGKRMKRPNQMMPIMGAMEENDTKEKERTKEKDAPTKPGTPPKRRENPFKDPNPGVKEDPRGEKKNKEKMKQDFIGLIKQVFQ